MPSVDPGPQQLVGLAKIESELMRQNWRKSRVDAGKFGIWKSFVARPLTFEE